MGLSSHSLKDLGFELTTHDFPTCSPTHLPLSYHIPNKQPTNWPSKGHSEWLINGKTPKNMEPEFCRTSIKNRHIKNIFAHKPSLVALNYMLEDGLLMSVIGIFHPRNNFTVYKKEAGEFFTPSFMCGQILQDPPACSKSGEATSFCEMTPA